MLTLILLIKPVKKIFDIGLFKYRYEYKKLIITINYEIYASSIEMRQNPRKSDKWALK